MEQNPKCNYLTYKYTKQEDLYWITSQITGQDSEWLTPYGIVVTLETVCPDQDISKAKEILLTVNYYHKRQIVPIHSIKSVPQAILPPVETLHLSDGLFAFSIIFLLVLILYLLKRNYLPTKNSPKKKSTPKKRPRTFVSANRDMVMDTPQRSTTTQKKRGNTMDQKRIDRFQGYQQEEYVINRIFTEHKIGVRVHPKNPILITPRTIMYPLQRAIKGRFSEISNLLETIESDIYTLRYTRGHKKKVSILLLTQPPSLIVPRVDPKVIPWEVDSMSIPNCNMLIGLTYSFGQPEPSMIDLNSPLQFSVLLGGSSGCGKSTLLDGMILSACAKSHPDKFRLSIIDIGKKHFGQFVKLPHCDQLLTTIDSALSFLSQVEKDMSGPEDTYTYRTAIIIDEIQKLTKCGIEKHEKEFKRLLMMIASNGRAYGYSIIISTQKPNAGTVPTDVRDNCVTRIAGRCKSSGQSEMILGSSRTEATNLTGVGSFILDDGEGTQIVYSYLVDTNTEITRIERQYPTYVRAVQEQDNQEDIDNPPVNIPEELIALFKGYLTDEGTLRRGWLTKATQLYGQIVGKSSSGDNYQPFRRIVIEMSQQYIEEISK